MVIQLRNRNGAPWTILQIDIFLTLSMFIFGCIFLIFLILLSSSVNTWKVWLTYHLFFWSLGSFCWGKRGLRPITRCMTARCRSKCSAMNFCRCRRRPSISRWLFWSWSRWCRPGISGNWRRSGRRGIKTSSIFPVLDEAHLSELVSLRRYICYRLTERIVA